MNFLDLVIIGGFLLGGLLGYRKGLISSLIGSVATLISLTISFAGYKLLMPIFSTQLKVDVFIRSMLKDSFSRQAGTIQPTSIVDSAGSFSPVTDGITRGVNNQFNQVYINLLHSIAGSTSKAIGDTMIQIISLLIVSMLSYVTIFVLSFSALRFVSKILTNRIHTNFIGALNSSGGFIAGALAAIMLIGIVTCFVVPIGYLYLPTLRHLANESLLTGLFFNTFVSMNSVFGL